MVAPGPYDNARLAAPTLTKHGDMRYTEAQLTSAALDQPEFIGAPIKIFICSTPRSGSYMLCRFMANAGLGVPHEYFNPNIMRQIAPRLGLGESVERLKWRRKMRRDRLPFPLPDRVAEMNFLRQYIERLVPRRCQSGVFAAKIHFDQYFTVLNNPVGHQVLDGGVFIHLFREDLLRQAVSRNFSYLTGRWGDDDTVTTEPSTDPGLLDPQRIDQELAALADEDREWRLLLARNGLAPLSISYEQLCRDPAAFVATIAARAGLEANALRQGYSESITPAQADDPAWPSKGDVIRRYLDSLRILHGSAPAKNRSAANPAPARREFVEP
jgi:LPS sulfotransferase NodH